MIVIVAVPGAPAVTVPTVFTLATKASVVTKRIAASGMESAFSSVTVTFSCLSAPASNASDAGLTAMVSGVSTTCASTSASSDPLVAVISDVPVPPTEVSSPSSFTVRIAPSLDANATDSPSTARPFASTTVTVSWSVWPIGTCGWLGVMTISAGVLGPASSPQAMMAAETSSAATRATDHGRSERVGLFIGRSPPSPLCPEHHHW